MASIKNLISYMTDMATTKDSRFLAIEPLLLQALKGKATFDTCRGSLLAKPNSGRTAGGYMKVYYDREYVDIPYTFKAGGTTSRWNTLNIVEQANNAINPFVERNLLQMDQWAEYGVDFYYEDGKEFLTAEYLKWDIFLTFKSTNVRNLQIEGTTDNRNPVKITWGSSYQDAFEVAVIQNGATVHTAAGQIEKTFTIPHGKLQAGEFTVQLTTANNPYLNWGQAFTNNQNFVATSTPPEIHALEPDGVNQSVDAAINVTWSSERQKSFTLKVFVDNMLTKTYQGETQTNVKIPHGTLPTGTIKLDLTISNTENNITYYATKQATFLGYGKPPQPIFEDKAIYTQAQPIINWSAKGQVAYIFELYKQAELIETSEEIASQETVYIIKTALENNTTYTLKLKIKNKYDLWSEEVSKDILISYTELPKPELTLVRDSGGILVTIIYPEDVADLKSLEIWRKDDIENYKRMAFNLKITSQWLDSTVASGVSYTYKIRGISKEGGITESDPLSEKAFVKNFIFENIETNAKQILVINPSIAMTSVSDITIRNFVGASKAKIERGTRNYKRMSCSFVIDSIKYREVENFFRKAKVVLFRDGRGEKFYGAIASSLDSNYINAQKSKISFTFEEINFLEKDLYSDMKLVLTYFNGAYFFDGSIDFSGVNVE